MPLYQFLVPAGGVSAARKADIAAAVTEVHTAVTGAPGRYVNVAFVETAGDALYASGRPVTQGRLVGLIRPGRSPEVKQALIHGLAAAWSRVTGEPADGFAIFLAETPGALMLEDGQTLPEAGGS